MPPVSKKNVSVILFDMRMKRDNSLYILNKILTFMQLQKKCECIMVLLHTNNKNPHNIEKVNNFNVASFNGKQFSSLINEREVKDANWLEGLEYASKLLKAYENDSSIINKQLIFITDLGVALPQFNNKNERIELLSNEIYRLEIYLYIIGPQVEQKATIFKRRSINSVMKQVSFVSVIPDEEVIRNIIDIVEGIICGADFGIHFLTYHCNEFPKQPWNTPLSMENYEFPTITRRILVPDELPIKATEPFYEKRYIALVNDWDDAGDNTVHPDDVIRVHCYLNKIINLPSDVNDFFKFKGNRMFKLLGFINEEELIDIYFEGKEAHRVEAIKDHPKAKSFNNLVQAAINLKKYGLALRSYNNNNAPRLYVLIPKLPHQFLMIPHAQKIVEKITLHPVKPDPSVNEKVKMFEKYFDYLKGRELSLCPSFGVGILHNNYLDKLIKKVSDVKVPQKTCLKDLDEKTALTKLDLSAVFIKPEIHKSGNTNLQPKEEEDDW